MCSFSVRLSTTASGQELLSQPPPGGDQNISIPRAPRFQREGLVPFPDRGIVIPGSSWAAVPRARPG